MSTTPVASARDGRKIRIGTVVSDRMAKTIVVRVDRLVQHPLYHRTIRRATRFKVHDEANTAKTGDVVKIAETRRLSKDKRWRLVEVLRRGSRAEPIPEDTVVTPQAGAGVS